MSGLGIDLGPPSEAIMLNRAEVPPMYATPPPRTSTRRRANVRTSTRTGQGSAKAGSSARLPNIPLRENRAMLNEVDNRPSPTYVMQHPLPAKPAVDWSAMAAIKPANAVLRADTPSDIVTPPLSRKDGTGVAQRAIHTRSLPRTPQPRHLAPPASSTPMIQAAAHVLPAKPQTKPMLPPERDERVGIEVFLENDVAVEGGYAHGCIRLQVPDHTDPTTAMLLAQPRVRLLGYESLPDEDTRHIFYRHGSVIDGDRSTDGPSEPYVLHGSPMLSRPEGAVQKLLPCFASLPDADGYSLGQKGTFILPFSLALPIDKGAKGSYRSSAAEVTYMIVASVRVKAFGEQNSGIAFCSQPLTLYPYLNPTAVLASSARPLVAQADSPEAESRQVHLAASLHRETWVAGQRIYFEASVLNHGVDTLNILRVALVCNETVYHTRGPLRAPEDGTVSSTIVADETLAASNSGHWWTGAPSGVPVHFAHSMVLPEDCLSVDRSRHVEVQYSLRLGVGAETSTLIEVSLPVRIVSFVSLDPPPPRKSWMSGPMLSGRYAPLLPDQQKMVERVLAMDSMRGSQPVVAQGLLSPNAAGDVVQTTRTAQHRRSLDFINSAIRSATARHTSPIPTLNEAPPAGLGIEVNASPSWHAASSPAVHARPNYTHGRNLPVLEVYGPDHVADETSLVLGDETVDDVKLVFEGQDHKQADDSYSIHGACHENYDFSNEASWQHSHRLSRPLTPTGASPVCVTAPTTPTHVESTPPASRGMATVPRVTKIRAALSTTGHAIEASSPRHRVD